MRPELAPATLALAVVWGGLVLGLLLGAVGQSTRFCVRGAIADWVALRQPGRLVGWLAAIAAGAVAVQALASLAVFDAGRTIYWSERFPWLSYLLGGLLFGYGMILAHGCPQRCLVKSGQGNLKAAVTLVIVGIVSLMTLRGAFAPLRTAIDGMGIALAGSQDLGGIFGRTLGVSTVALRWVFALAIAAAVAAFAWRMRSRIRTGQWLGGIAVGLIVGAAFWLTGSYGFLAEHPETLEPAWLGTQSRRPEALSFSAPLGHALDLLTLWTDKATVPTFGVMLSLGVLIGAFVTAKLRRDFHLESFKSPRDLVEHVVGAVFMGFGGITALGCSLGNGVTGLAMLSAGAVLAVIGITLGARLALVRQMRGQPAATAVATS